MVYKKVWNECLDPKEKSFRENLYKDLENCLAKTSISDHSKWFVLSLLRHKLKNEKEVKKL